MEPAGAHQDHLRHILRQICEQPDIVIRGLEIPHKEIAFLASLVLKSKRTVLVGDDTSYSLAFFSQSLLAKLAGVSVAAMGPEEVQPEILLQPDTLLLAISESGESSKMIELLRRAKAIGIANAVMVTATETPLACEAGVAVELNVASGSQATRGNGEMAQIVTLTRLAVELAYLRRSNFTKNYVHILEELAHVPKCMEIVLRNYQSHLEKVAHDCRDKHHWRILGGSFFAPATLLFAIEAAEIASFHVEGIPTYLEENLGSPVDPSTLYIACLPPPEAGTSYHEVLDDIERVRGFGAKVVAFCFSDTGRKIAEVRLPKISQWVAPLLHVFSTELLAYETALVARKL